tara:strand:- start:677 stop:952 length:276 start_codon:yes stop_codon:yes gene_type:complete
MDDNFVPYLYIGNVLTNGVDNAGCIGTADVEIFNLTALLAGSYYIDRDPSPCPNIVVVNPSGHHINQGIVWAYRGNIYHFTRKGLKGFSKA